MHLVCSGCGRQCRRGKCVANWDDTIASDVKYRPLSYHYPEKAKFRIGEHLIVVARDVPAPLPAGG